MAIPLQESPWRNGEKRMTDQFQNSSRSPKKPKLAKLLLALVVVGGLVAGVGYVNRSAIRGFIDSVSEEEFTGEGTGLTEFTVAKGDTGETVAKHLAEQGVTKDYATTLRHIIAANPTFFPGTYSIPLQISSNRAIELLTNPTNMETNKVTIPEGWRVKDIIVRLSKVTGISEEKFEAEAEDLAQFDLPKAAPSLEGYLFPATYSFDKSLDAKGILTIMANRMKQELDRYGVEKKDWHKTLTFASIVQREARLTEDFYKVSRVFRNRLDINMALQSCATASYGVGEFSIIVTNRILNDDNPYNTYKYAGLPLGPISAPGSLALDATLNPVDGSWLYFVTWNLETGETIFSNTFAEHEAGIAKWDKWMAENPGWDE